MQCTCVRLPHQTPLVLVELLVEELALLRGDAHGGCFARFPLETRMSYSADWVVGRATTGCVVRCRCDAFWGFASQAVTV